MFAVSFLTTAQENDFCWNCLFIVLLETFWETSPTAHYSLLSIIFLWKLVLLPIFCCRSDVWSHMFQDFENTHIWFCLCAAICQFLCEPQLLVLVLRIFDFTIFQGVFCSKCCLFVAGKLFLVIFSWSSFKGSTFLVTLSVMFLPFCTFIYGNFCPIQAHFSTWFFYYFPCHSYNLTIP